LRRRKNRHCNRPVGQDSGRVRERRASGGSDYSTKGSTDARFRISVPQGEKGEAVGWTYQKAASVRK